MITSPLAAAPWTCPFCPLACDHFGVRVGSGAQALELEGGSCERASRALSAFASAAAVAAPEIDGQAAGLDAAIAAAVARLAVSRQPLFAGLGTDVAGMRALGTGRRFGGSGFLSFSIRRAAPRVPVASAQHDGDGEQPADREPRSVPGTRAR